MYGIDESLNNTLLMGGETITDSAGNYWTFDNGRVAENSIVDTGTSGVIAIAYVNGIVWQENNHQLWWAKTNAPGAYDGWSPNGGTPVNPVPASANKTILTPGNLTLNGVGIAGDTLVDGKGNTWYINTNKQVVENGKIDATTANVIELAYVNGTIWQENASQLWWSHTIQGYPWAQGLPPVGVPKQWVGGGNNQANNPADWSPSGQVPKPGDTLNVPAGTINVSGNALAGNSLRVGPDSPTDSLKQVTVNVSGNTPMQLTANPYTTSATVNLAAMSQWIGGFAFQNADSLVVQGAGSFNNTTSVLNGPVVIKSDVTGTGTFWIFSAHAQASLEFMHGVSAGQTIDVAGYELYGGEFGILQIDDPKAFHGSIRMGFGSVLLEGLKADSYSLLNGILSLYNGKTVVDAVPLSLHDSTGSNTPGPLNVVQLAGAIAINTDNFFTNGIMLGMHT